MVNKLAITTIHHSIIPRLVEDCHNDLDIDRKVHILFKINSLLPKSYCIDIPSLITDHYIDTALYQIEKGTSIVNNLFWVIIMELSILCRSKGRR